MGKASCNDGWFLRFYHWSIIDLRNLWFLKGNLCGMMTYSVGINNRRQWLYISTTFKILKHMDSVLQCFSHLQFIPHDAVFIQWSYFRSYTASIQQGFGASPKTSIPHPMQKSKTIKSFTKDVSLKGVWLHLPLLWTLAEMRDWPWQRALLGRHFNPLGHSGRHVRDVSSGFFRKKNVTYDA